VSFNQQGLAWNPEDGERKRLLRIVSAVLPVFFIAVVYISWITLPEQDRQELEKLPPQLAKVILKKQKPKPEPKLVKKPEIEKPKPESKVAKKPKPKKVDKPKPRIVKEQKLKPKHKPEELKLAREKAKNSGLLAMSNQLSALSALADNVKLDTPKTLTAKPIARKVEDKLAASATSTKSGGMRDANLTQDTQELTLASRQATELEKADEIFMELEVAELEAKRLVAQRTREDIRRTMDANKAAINSIYNRELRKKPSLRGAFTAQLVVEPSGQVSSCMTTDSTLKEPSLESKICKRLRLVNFGQKQGVDTARIDYPIELFPG
tara:strand:- start:3185 stop:4153 length:969 start_codon:yes stop_codon:yes gene_type:complete